MLTGHTGEGWLPLRFAIVERLKDLEIRTRDLNGFETKCQNLKKYGSRICQKHPKTKTLQFKMFQHQVILPKYQIFERIISTYALRMIVKKPDMIIDIIDLK